MRFNDKLLYHLSQGESVIEGRLHYKKVGGNLPPSGFKERWFKLRLNILFYFNLSEVGTVLDLKPAGAFILEDCTALKEIFAETPFTFSLKFGDDKDRKHVFSGRTEDSISQWVHALNTSSCGNLRRQIYEMQRKLAFLTGQTFNEFGLNSEELEDTADVFPKKPTFKSYIKNVKDSNPTPPNNEVRGIDDFFNSLGAISEDAEERNISNNHDLINSEASTVVSINQPHRKAPDPPRRPPRNVKPTVSSSSTENNLIQF